MECVYVVDQDMAVLSRAACVQLGLVNCNCAVDRVADEPDFKSEFKMMAKDNPGAVRGIKDFAAPKCTKYVCGFLDIFNQLNKFSTQPNKQRGPLREGATE